MATYNETKEKAKKEKKKKGKQREEPVRNAKDSESGRRYRPMPSYLTDRARDTKSTVRRSGKRDLRKRLC